MYAVIATGGKQYRVELGTELEVELLDAEPGEEINLERVLLVADGEDVSVGRPIVEDAVVSARVLRQDRGEKTISFKYRPKARRRVKKGHRQELTVLQITDVRLGDRSAAARARAAEEQQASERERISQAAARQAAEDAALAEKLAQRKQAAAESEAPDANAKPRRGRARATPDTATAEAPSVESAPVEPAPAETPAEDQNDNEAPGAVPAEGAEDQAPKRRPRAKKDE
jgi:large subunit ribosomal protein L21